jgi:hypothetical protein
MTEFNFKDKPTTKVAPPSKMLNNAPLVVGSNNADESIC